MSSSKYIGSLTCVVLVWAGLGSLAERNPLASGSARGQQAAQPQPDAGNVIRGQGIIETTGHEDIRCRVTQPLTVLYTVSYGSKVKKGDLLVELDAYALMQESEEQQIRFMKADAELAAAEASLPGVQQVAKDMVLVAEKALHIAQQQLEAYRSAEYPIQEIAATNEVRIAEERAAMLKERADELEAACKEQGTKPLPQELLEVRLASSQARAAMTLAQDKLRTLKEVARPHRTEELELAIAQRELDLLRAKNELAQVLQKGKSDIQIAKSIRQMEMGRLQILGKQIEMSRLHAPRDGTVLSPRDGVLGGSPEAEVRPGDTARFGQLFLRVADLTQLKLDVHLSLPQAQKLAPGQPATVRREAHGPTFRGHITGTRVLTDSDAADDPVGAIVTVRLDDPIKGLRPGMKATAEFELSGAQQAMRPTP